MDFLANLNTCNSVECLGDLANAGLLLAKTELLAVSDTVGRREVVRLLVGSNKTRIHDM